MIRFGARLRDSVVFQAPQYWTMGLMDWFWVRTSVLDKDMEGTEIGYHWRMSMTLRARIFLRVRNSVESQIPQHCSVALMSTVRLSIRALH